MVASVTVALDSTINLKSTPWLTAAGRLNGPSHGRMVIPPAIINMINNLPNSNVSTGLALSLKGLASRITVIYKLCIHRIRFGQISVRSSGLGKSWSSHCHRSSYLYTQCICTNSYHQNLLFVPCCNVVMQKFWCLKVYCCWTLLVDSLVQYVCSFEVYSNLL